MSWELTEADLRLRTSLHLMGNGTRVMALAVIGVSLKKKISRLKDSTSVTRSNYREKEMVLKNVRHETQ
jgi:hypothetical protein